VSGRRNTILSVALVAGLALSACSSDSTETADAEAAAAEVPAAKSDDASAADAKAGEVKSGEVAATGPVSDEAKPGDPQSAETAKPAAPVGESGPPKPYQLVRTLNALQDQTGVGNKTAHMAQRSLLQRIGEEMEQVPNETWADPRNGRALVSYVLSGGEPAVIKRLLDEKIEIAGVDKVLAAAAVAYAERRSDEATAFLAKVNPREIEPSLAAHVALVQGIVFAQREPERAIKAFELARLFAPGSLVEQGALRRQAMVASKLGRWDEAEKLSAQYLRRFGQAVYAPTFYRELAEQLAGEPDTRDENQFSRLTKLFNLLGERQRRQTYLLLAEKSILTGKVKMARFAAARASELYAVGSRERARLEVYGAAADVASEQTPAGLAVLQAVDRRRLGTRDSLLADAATEVGADVRREPVEMVVDEKAAQLAEDALTAEQIQSDPPPIIDTARKSIGKADELLKAAKK
jgi:chemotaxis protein MotC